MIIDKNYIGNHTNSHTSLDGISKEQFINEIEVTEKAVVDAAGDLIPEEVRLYMRPPYGATDPNTRAYAAELGYYVVIWDIDTEDWRRPGARQIADTILKNAYPGAIILMHDGGGDRTQTVEALKIALPELSNQGYVFKNIFHKDLDDL
jgi:peptidoglycan/xylan/chitin deacetylase (PgdA/CDA1 family)